MKGFYDMKKILCLLIALMMLVSGCQETSDLVKEPEIEPTVNTQVEETPLPTEEPEEPKTTIPLTQTLKMTNDWTIMGDFDYSITKQGKKDRIVLATSAKSKNGNMMWDDSQFWTLAVISEDGAYNLFNERMQGYVYAEVNETFIRGMATTVITAYIFSGNDREVRNYIFEDDMFVEYKEYSTKQFSTGGVNNLYTTIPEPEEE